MPAPGGAIQDEPNRIILGEHHYIDLMPESDSGPNAGQVVGGVVYHRAPWNESGWCGGSVFWAAGEHRVTWELHSRDPLHIEPSVRCTHDQDSGLVHGWIRGGRWEPIAPYHHLLEAHA